MGAGKAMDNRTSATVLEPKEVYDTAERRKMWKHVTTVLEGAREQAAAPGNGPADLPVERVRKPWSSRQASRKEGVERGRNELSYDLKCASEEVGLRLEGSPFIPT